MLSASRCPRRSSFSSNPTFTIIAIALLGSVAAAQQKAGPAALPEAPVAQPSTTQIADAGSEQELIVPPGNRFALVLTHPLDSKTTRSGDQINAQISAPVIVDNQVAIPAGTYLQGQVEKMKRDGSRGLVSLRSASLVFPNGYVAHLQGSAEVISEEGTAWNNPSTATKTGIILAPLLGTGIGTAVGAAADTTQTTNFAGMTMTSSTPKGIAIGSMTGLAAGAVVSFVLLGHSHHFYVQEGSPLQMTLSRPLTLDASQVMDAARVASQAPPPVIARRPSPAISNQTDPGTCYTPGTPGTPDVYVPGTPAIGDSPGTPGTYIPGMPATPPVPHPCP